MNRSAIYLKGFGCTDDSGDASGVIGFIDVYISDFFEGYSIQHKIVLLFFT